MVYPKNLHLPLEYRDLVLLPGLWQQPHTGSWGLDGFIFGICCFWSLFCLMNTFCSLSFPFKVSLLLPHTIVHLFPHSHDHLWRGSCCHFRGASRVEKTKLEVELKFFCGWLMIAGVPHPQEICVCGLKTNNGRFYRILSRTEVSKLPLVLFVGAIRLCLVDLFSVFVKFCYFISLIKGQDLCFLPENALKEGEAPPSQWHSLFWKRGNKLWGCFGKVDLSTPVFLHVFFFFLRNSWITSAFFFLKFARPFCWRKHFNTWLIHQCCTAYSFFTLDCFVMPISHLKELQIPALIANQSFFISGQAVCRAAGRRDRASKSS